MGFGSGGGGFTPSPNNVPGSTQTGTDKDTDLHQFTGSVDITGSLTLNGSSVTGGGGGGGGAVSSYTNSGNNRVITSVNSNTINGEANLTFDGTKMGVGSNHTPTAVLHVSSSTTTLPLLRVDQHDQALSKPILYVTGSGLVAIGTDSPRTDTGDTNRLHILAESGADQGINPAVNSALVLENNDHVGLNIITPNNRSGMIIFGDADVANRAYFRYEHGNAGQGAGTDRFFFDGTFGEEVLSIARAGDSINMGKNNSAHMLTNKASLHISSSTEGADVGGPVLLKVDHANQPGAQPTLFVTGSGRVGIGTDSVLANLHVSSSDTGDLFRIDHEDDDDNPIFVVTGSGRVGIGTATPGAVLDVHPDNAAGSNEVKFRGSNGTSHFYFSSAEHTYIRGGKQTSTVFIADSRNTGGSDNQKCIIGNAGSTTAQLHVSSSDNSTVMNVTSNSGSILTALENQRVGIGTDAPEHTLSVSGSAAFSGTFGSTAFETIAATSGIANVTTGTTILDVTSQANNAFYSFAVADGAFPGQQKNFIFKSTFGGASANTNGLQLTGSNIGTAIAGTSTGLIIMSASDSGGGYFGAVLGSAMLMWDGSKWNVMANVNTQVSAT